MSFDNLTVERGTIGSKSDNISEIPEAITKLVDDSWNYTREHPNQFHSVKLASEEERDTFHLFARAAAKAHDPVLDYRKLPRPGDKDKTVAYFTLRLLTADTPRPGRPPASQTADASVKTDNTAKADDKDANKADDKDKADAKG